jgi:hypothetical protein
VNYKYCGVRLTRPFRINNPLEKAIPFQGGLFIYDREPVSDPAALKLAAEGVKVFLRDEFTASGS